jgi:hypothetical protein
MGVNFLPQILYEKICQKKENGEKFARLKNPKIG